MRWRADPTDQKLTLRTDFSFLLFYLLLLQLRNTRRGFYDSMYGDLKDSFIR
jgi:hypothetical protein